MSQDFDYIGTLAKIDELVELVARDLAKRDNIAIADARKISEQLLITTIQRRRKERS